MKNLIRALPRKAALGSFTVGNMEMVLGAVKAAEETGTPIVLQIAEARLRQSPLVLFGPLMLKAAQDASVEIGVHLDHGSSAEAIGAVAKMGFTSVMYDGSHLPFRENIAATQGMAALVGGIGAGISVEGELGVVGGCEDDGAERTVRCTEPGQVGEFCAATGVDALAVAIGNAHGNYRAAPELRFDILDRIAAETDVPLVLHGGSGITDAGFRKAIRHGIRKINIATAVFQSVIAQLRSRLEVEAFHDYRPLNEAMIEGAYESVKKHISVFNQA